MANWAYNTVTVEGKAEFVKTVYGLLKNYSEDTDKGHSPLEHQTKEWDFRYLFYISFDFDELEKDQTDFTFHCESKWQDPKDTLLYLSNIFNLDIVNYCQELSGGIYKETYYSNGKELACFGIDEDELIEEDQDNIYDLYDEIIEKKKKQLLKMLA